MSALLLLASLAFAAAPGVRTSTASVETSDGWTLSAVLTSPKGAREAVALLHGLDSGKQEWRPLADALARRGVASLAIDLRGHGGSLGADGRHGWRSFKPGPDGEWAGLWKDAEGGLRWLRARGYKRVGLVGASIGAEAALRAAVKRKDAAFAALLSPVLDPASAETASLMEALGPRPLLLAASWPDARSYASASGLARLRGDQGLPADWIQGASGHGAQMFADAETLDKIADWLAARAK